MIIIVKHPVLKIKEFENDFEWILSTDYTVSIPDSFLNNS